MTDQPYTPTTEQIELLVLGQLKQSVEKRDMPVDVEADRADFRHWLAERDARIEAAAEQRGAVRHLREVASELNMHHLTEDLSDEALELGVRYINLIQDRADQMEGDDE